MMIIELQAAADRAAVAVAVPGSLDTFVDNMPPMQPNSPAGQQRVELTKNKWELDSSSLCLSI